MKRRTPEGVPPLFARPPDPPRNDAAPLAGGAGVNGPSASPESTLVRLPLIPPARHNAPAGTSSVAAARIAGHAAKQRADVLAVIVRAGVIGATDAEIQAALTCCPHSVSPRRGELRALGLVVDSGRRRPTPRGRPAAVWVASTFATAPTTTTATTAPTIDPGASAGAGGPEGGGT